jgi:regulator of RNase E activity RraA
MEKIMTHSKQIVDYIRNNRISTTEVADTLNKSGVIPNVLPMTSDFFKVGSIRCVFAANESNYAVHEQVRDVEKGEVVLIFAHNCGDRAILGELVAKYILLYQSAEALVVDGLVRDAAVIRRERYPVWCKGVTPIGCFNKPAEPFPIGLQEDLRERFEHGIAVCDDGGVVVIPPHQLNEEMLERLQRIELQEDLWHFCLNTLKWDTKQIVCDKEYLKNPELLPAPFLKNIESLSKPLDNK